jgi:hypothetical protein
MKKDEGKNKEDKHKHKGKDQLTQQCEACQQKPSRRCSPRGNPSPPPAVSSSSPLQIRPAWIIHLGHNTFARESNCSATALT